MSGPVHITGTHDDIVQVIRTWDVEAPDWVPAYHKRPIAVRKVVGVWVDGVLSRAGVSGPHRLKSGATADPAKSGTVGGSGSPDYRPAENYTITVVHRDGEISGYTREELPDWVWGFLADHGPTL